MLFVWPHLDYCSSLFTCLNKKELVLLLAVQNSAAHISSVFASLHWLPVNFRINFEILVLTFGTLHAQAPSYISDLIQPHTPTRSLTSSGQRSVVLNHTHFKTWTRQGINPFKQSLPDWNKFPPSLLCSISLIFFSKEVENSVI